MSESRLRAFAEDATRLVDLPELAALERRGHDLRSRRRTSVVVSVVLLALLGTWVTQQRVLRADGPDTVDTPARPVAAYPGNRMQDLEPGTYELHPSRVPGEPTARLTVPEGWNDWEGPNRFNGHRPDDPTTGRYNDVPLGRASWYVGVVVVKLLAVTRELCWKPLTDKVFVETYAETVRAMGRIPGYRVTEGPTPVADFGGYPATRFTYHVTPALETCREGAHTFITSTNGSISGEPDMTAWVVDVGGTPLTVFTGQNGAVPEQYLAERDAVVASIEFREAT